MCPSFRVTLDEKYSTRGRIRLFGELFRGEVLKDLWANEDVKDALELCFSCKSCKSECPAQVDMATYKAEFLSHYHETHRRPRQAYSMGWIHRWAGLASLAPRFVNTVGRLPGLGSLAKHVAGVAPQREMPAFARRTFRRWFQARGIRSGTGRRVLLWPDTFNNHFHPESAIAATRVLEACGYVVDIPKTRLCCGRPLYDFGMLDEARRQLEQIMVGLKQDIELGTPIIGLEPACVSVFKDELPNLFPDDPIARRLADQVTYFSDFLKSVKTAAPRSAMRARVHGHCHHKAVIGMSSELQLLEGLGVKVSPIQSGCCGMAGSIGFRPETYDLSVKAAEQDLLPAVRNAASDEIIIASGYSCREQIDQLSPRKAVHVAEVAAHALGLKNDD